MSETMQQTPAHERHNSDLLAVLPIGAKRIIEVGCSSGALGREYKKINPRCHYTGIEIDPEQAALDAMSLQYVLRAVPA
ncbi:MAG: class I SAM-dependent methyltransferase [Methylococcus sp.]|nr:class I SAM-dependent methyltransferase [Methylococcus sp.]